MTVVCIRIHCCRLFWVVHRQDWAECATIAMAKAAERANDKAAEQQLAAMRMERDAALQAADAQLEARYEAERISEELRGQLFAALRQLESARQMNAADLAAA